MTAIPIPTDREEHVYFMQARYDPWGFIKVGCTKDMNKRLERLNRFSPEPLRIIGALAGAGQETETYLHRVWDEHRSWGEWFAAVPEIRDFIAERAESPPESHLGKPRVVAGGVAAEAEGRTDGIQAAMPQREIWDEDDYNYAIGLYEGVADTAGDWIDRLTRERDSRYAVLVTD